MMVGGQNSFVAGGYAGTPLARVLPIALDGNPGATAADTSPFVPEWTDEGRSSPLLAPLRSVHGDELPQMPGANVLGEGSSGRRSRCGPIRRGPPRSGAKMPVLAVGERGDGRSVALGVDGAWLLEFSALGARTAGRGHGAVWDGLLGWLMRDPRFETAQMDIPGGCTAGLPSTLRVRMLPLSDAASKDQTASLEIRRIDKPGSPVQLARPRPPGASSIEIGLPPLGAGGYAARLRIAGGTATRFDFACEAGGDEWADSRPDPEEARATRAQANRWCLCVRRGSRHSSAAGTDGGQRRAARDAGGSAVGLDACGLVTARNALDCSPSRWTLLVLLVHASAWPPAIRNVTYPS